MVFASNGALFWQFSCDEGKRPLAKRLRWTIYMLQLLSTVLKNERGASHPERSNHPSANQVPGLPGDPPKATLAARTVGGKKWRRKHAPVNPAPT
ncbi:unnamed protein product [Ectocarpus fasciculatus]